ncbi:Ig-like domain-containing protein [Actinoplanes sp. NPDC051470]|uniref:Ig-like domain-containing protein n=1 Tax=Actinoplanes sp. NPDC051470 TaxID=3157224 RepID=UPI0034439FA5
MNTRGFASVVVLAGLLIAGAATPASAADEPLITSTGLVDGQYLGLLNQLHPIVSDDVARMDVLVDGAKRWGSTGWPIANFRVPFRIAEQDHEVSLTLRAFDVDGASAEATTRVRVDVLRPVLTTNPARGTVIHGRTEITVLPDVDDLAQVVMTDASGAEIARRTEAPWVFSWDAIGKSGDVRFIATDRAGNASDIYPARYSVDDQGPVLSMAYGIYQRPGLQYLNADVSEKSKVNRIEWYVDGAFRGTGTRIRTDLGTKIRTVPVETRAWDEWDNYSVQKFGIRLDASAPAVTAASPGQNALVRGSKISGRITVADPAGILQVDMLGYPVVVDHPSTYSTRLPVGRDGGYTFFWYLRDRLGNEGSFRRTVIVDNTPPKITKVTAPASNAKVPATVKTTVAATDKNGITRVELRVNGKLVLSDAKAPYNLNLNATKYGTSFTVAFYAIDRAGNIVSTSRRTWKR